MEQTAQGIDTQMLLRLMQENDMPDEARELKELLQYVTRMEQQCGHIMEELHQVKDQLSKLELKQETMGGAFTNSERNIASRVERAREQIQKIRQGIEDKASGIVEGFRRGGVSALRKTAELLSVRKLLHGIQENLGHAANGTKRAVARLEATGERLRTASDHLRNAGRAAAGHEAQPVEHRPEGRFQSAVLLPMRGVAKTLDKMQIATATAMYNVARFEQGQADQEKLFALPAHEQERQTSEDAPAFTMSM